MLDKIRSSSYTPNNLGLHLGRSIQPLINLNLIVWSGIRDCEICFFFFFNLICQEKKLRRNSCQLIKYCLNYKKIFLSHFLHCIGRRLQITCNGHSTYPHPHPNSQPNPHPTTTANPTTHTSLKTIIFVLKFKKSNI